MNTEAIIEKLLSIEEGQILQTPLDRGTSQGTLTQSPWGHFTALGTLDRVLC